MLHIVRLAIALVCLAIAGIGSPVSAAPRSDVNKNAVTIAFDCGEIEFGLVTILHNAAVAGQIVNGPGVVGHLVAAWGYSDLARTQDEVQFWTTPGYDHNGLTTITCDLVNPNDPTTYMRVLVAVEPVR
jgi:hypothetical protein